MYRSLQRLAALAGRNAALLRARIYAVQRPLRGACRARTTRPIADAPGRSRGNARARARSRFPPPSPRNVKPIPSFAPLTWRSLRAAARERQLSFMSRSVLTAMRDWSSKEVAMRVSPLLSGRPALASCTMAPPPPGYAQAQAAQEQADFQRAARRQGSGGSADQMHAAEPDLRDRAMSPRHDHLRNAVDLLRQPSSRAAARGLAIPLCAGDEKRR